MEGMSGLMQSLYAIRERSKEYYGKYSFVIDPVLRFCVAFLALALINGSIGYMGGLKNVLVVLMISLICALLPYGGICTVLSAVILLHISRTSLEMAAICAVYLIVVAGLYYTFSPGNSAILLLTPIAFALKIPYVVPFLAGLGSSVFAVVPVAAGTMFYYLLHYVKEYAGSTMHDSSTEIAQHFLPMMTGVFADKEVYVVIGVFVAAIAVIYIIHMLSVDYSWYIAVGAGAAVLLAGSLIGSMIFDIELDVVMLLVGVLLGMLTGAAYTFFGFAVDYTKTEFVQFEDDDYYYYVKAVPKISAVPVERRFIEDDVVAAKPRSRKNGAKHG
jgi:hypothetical protein